MPALLAEPGSVHGVRDGRVYHWPVTPQGTRKPLPPQRVGPPAWSRWPVLRTLAAWYDRRPFLTTFALLAAGMAVMVILFGQDAGLTLRQHAVLVVVTIGLAALCTWIIFLETPDGPERSGTADAPKPARDDS